MYLPGLQAMQGVDACDTNETQPHDHHTRSSHQLTRAAAPAPSATL
jgi:hypothetical protein